ncbi:MAG: ABC transporter ATP-binding protein [Candidatus Neomarinimicrobiota bacterium]
MSEIVLRTHHLTKFFKGRKAVANLDLEVGEGEIFGFLGPNGAGKSTTIRLMLALIKPDAGDVEVLGKSISKFRNEALRGVGALIEEPSFYKNISARKNLQMLANLERLPYRRIDRVLEHVGLMDRGNDRVKTYSHGMKQRLGIGQALLSEPKVLILDEPTTGLDPQGMKEVRELIVNLASGGTTIFLSSHLLHEVEQVCTSMAIINEGKMVTTGKVADLLEKGELFATEIKAFPLDKAQTVLKKLEYVKTVSVVGDTLKVTISSTDLSDLTKTLVENGIQVSAVIPRTSLEDYFLSLTGE